ncbi:amidohydrolase [Oceanirhabdus sp. W0125-5]|uniref:amidohydrolase n=1 Tax=Oceanirhabdus sp. W0125-5 TaxID=2999116 RepID=UPI0022F2F882|nr:amidohydrolase [Oceanirhabdus sp. W0125-5]WBW99474.1 amidohydrolase [Oceanirhabdus sp. W0125-5]
MDGEKIIQNGNILIEGNIIKKVFVGEVDESHTKYIDTIIDGSGLCSLPGFINCHTHVPMTLLRGEGEGKSLMKWLKESIWPKEEQFKKEHIKVGASLAFIEMIKSGSTTFNDMYLHEREIIESAIENKIRGFFGYTIMGEKWREHFKKSKELHNLINSLQYDKMKNYTVAPHSPYLLSEEALNEIAIYAKEKGSIIHTHIAETKDECNIIKERYGTTPVKFLKRCNVFESKVVAAHSIYLDDEDMDIYKNNGVSAIYNPQSNMKLASGVAKIKELKEKNINVCLGTDGTSSNNNLNMFEEMETGAMLQKLHYEDPAIFNGYEMLQMATVNGAKALGIEKLGKICEGYIADVVMLNMKEAEMMPDKNLLSNLVFSANGGEVLHVIINGEIIMKNKEMIYIDEEKILFESNKLAKNLI